MRMRDSGRTDVVTVYAPVYAVTAEDGSFELDGVPAGMPVIIHAWHPLFQEGVERLEVAHATPSQIEFSITPAVQPEVSPPDPDAPPPENDPAAAGPF